eukprot:CAMPEP_0172468246 /NCGR_PEP_ID=MMETSP1065-20121228/60871_1 /TAXON_ID=265537 /ORGANISM="Amphiprora paludosa, Strain CCMP125" /LENGTH=699 /DNA_ID=CAMNT_0013225601 /DNA_START=283 /DNA_END=2382 /DNA_ORIENTATION=-
MALNFARSTPTTLLCGQGLGVVQKEKEAKAAKGRRHSGTLHPAKTATMSQDHPLSIATEYAPSFVLGGGIPQKNTFVEEGPEESVDDGSFSAEPSFDNTAKKRESNQKTHRPTKQPNHTMSLGSFFDAEAAKAEQQEQQALSNQDEEEDGRNDDEDDQSLMSLPLETEEVLRQVVRQHQAKLLEQERERELLRPLPPVVSVLHEEDHPGSEEHVPLLAAESPTHADSPTNLFEVHSESAFTPSSSTSSSSSSSSRGIIAIDPLASSGSEDDPFSDHHHHDMALPDLSVDPQSSAAPACLQPCLTTFTPLMVQQEEEWQETPELSLEARHSEDRGTDTIDETPRALSYLNNENEVAIENENTAPKEEPVSSSIMPSLVVLALCNVVGGYLAATQLHSLFPMEVWTGVALVLVALVSTGPSRLSSTIVLLYGLKMVVLTCLMSPHDTNQMVQVMKDEFFPLPQEEVAWNSKILPSLALYEMSNLIWILAFLAPHLSCSRGQSSTGSLSFFSWMGFAACLVGFYVQGLVVLDPLVLNNEWVELSGDNVNGIIMLVSDSRDFLEQHVPFLAASSAQLMDVGELAIWMGLWLLNTGRISTSRIVATAVTLVLMIGWTYQLRYENPEISSMLPSKDEQWFHVFQSVTQTTFTRYNVQVSDGESRSALLQACLDSWYVRDSGADATGDVKSWADTLSSSMLSHYVS